jgi:hypothetical protein
MARIPTALPIATASVILGRPSVNEVSPSDDLSGEVFMPQIDPGINDGNDDSMALRGIPCRLGLDPPHAILVAK